MAVLVTVRFLLKATVINKSRCELNILAPMIYPPSFQAVQAKKMNCIAFLAALSLLVLTLAESPQDKSDRHLDDIEEADKKDPGLYHALAPETTTQAIQVANQETASEEVAEKVKEVPLPKATSRGLNNTRLITKIKEVVQNGNTISNEILAGISCGVTVLMACIGFMIRGVYLIRRFRNDGEYGDCWLNFLVRMMHILARHQPIASGKPEIESGESENPPAVVLRTPDFYE